MPRLTAQDCRDHSEKTFQQIKAGFEEHQNPPSATVSIGVHTLQALWEIAAQLAELNERAGKDERCQP